MFTGDSKTSNQTNSSCLCWRKNNKEHYNAKRLHHHNRFHDSYQNKYFLRATMPKVFIQISLSLSLSVSLFLSLSLTHTHTHTAHTHTHTLLTIFHQMKSQVLNLHWRKTEINPQISSPSRALDCDICWQGVTQWIAMSHSGAPVNTATTDMSIKCQVFFQSVTVRDEKFSAINLLWWCACINCIVFYISKLKYVMNGVLG